MVPVLSNTITKLLQKVKGCLLRLVVCRLVSVRKEGSNSNSSKYL